MSAITELVQSLELGSIVDLYDIDFEPIGLSQTAHFTAADASGQGIMFGGVFYEPRPIEMAGFSRSSEGAPPEPTLTISNVDKGGNMLLNSYNDLIGVKVVRRRTFSKFLDHLPDGSPNPNADPAAQLIPEIWYVEQKVEANRHIIQWRMKSVLDLQGVMIPKRKVLKSVCERRYRTYKDGNWVYPTVNACPYAGWAMFDRDGNPTSDPTKDMCAKHFRACGLRFPDEPLPGWFFPGVNQLPE